MLSTPVAVGLVCGIPKDMDKARHVETALEQSLVDSWAAANQVSPLHDQGRFDQFLL